MTGVLRRAATVVSALLLLTGTLGPAGAATGRAGSTAAEERVVLGWSAQGRPIVAWHRWRPGAGGARPLLVVGSMHGDERAGHRVVRALRKRPLPPGSDLWLVRTLNPDGAAARTRTNARGVDLNHNFPGRWQRSARGSVTWSGPAPASEPETAAVMAFVRSRQPWTTVVLHQPLYGVDSYRAKSPRLVRGLAAATGLPVRSFDCGGMCHGTFTDWLNARTPGRAVTVEPGRDPTPTRVARVARGVLQAGTRHVDRLPAPDRSARPVHLAGDAVGQVISSSFSRTA